jgi:hypothetical protein
MKTFVLMIGAVVVAFAAATATFVLLGLLLMPLQRFDGQSAVFHGVRAVLFFTEGFAFIFAGSLIMPRRWRGAAAFGLLLVGGAFFVEVNGGESTGGLPAWHLVASVVGGLLAMVAERLRPHANAEPDDPPNGGPATQFGNSRVTEGPPSVS